MRLANVGNADKAWVLGVASGRHQLQGNVTAVGACRVPSPPGRPARTHAPRPPLHPPPAHTPCLLSCRGVTRHSHRQCSRRRHPNSPSVFPRVGVAQAGAGAGTLFTLVDVTQDEAAEFTGDAVWTASVSGQQHIEFDGSVSFTPQQKQHFVEQGCVHRPAVCWLARPPLDGDPQPAARPAVCWLLRGRLSSFPLSVCPRFPRSRAVPSHTERQRFCAACRCRRAGTST